MDPSIHNDDNVNDFRFINFPWKIDIFIKHFINFDMDIYGQIPQDLISLLRVFTFGNDEYIRKQLTAFESNMHEDQPPRRYGTTERNPFYRKKRKRRARD